MRSAAGHVTFFAPCKVIQFQECGEFLLVECRICETNSSVDSVTLGFEIHNSAKGIPLTIGIRNPSSTYKKSATLKSTAWDPESNTALDFLTLADLLQRRED